MTAREYEEALAEYLRCDTDAFERCGRCDQLFGAPEIDEGGLCGACRRGLDEDLPAGAELERSVRYAGRS